VRAVGAGPEERGGHGPDLYLACACARGDRAALRIVDGLLQAIGRQLSRIGIPAGSIDDVLQATRISVLGEERPAILKYGGRGPLTGWLRKVAFRTALAMLPKRTADRGASASLLSGLVAEGDDPELGAIRRRHRQAFQHALDESLTRLSRRDKTVLRMHYVDGLSAQAIAAVYHVHRVTVTRWLITIRAEIFAGLRERFSLSQEPTSADLRSLAFALGAELHISVDRLLGHDSH
jgi:RNA polymerase sigma-70 factor, ECF subfamily